MKPFNSFLFVGILLGVLAFPLKGFTETTILDPKETLWLESRNNTIVVYPEKNFPPYSYQNSSGIPQGLSIDFIELIAEKIGAKITYLPARSRSQIIDDVKKDKKGDVVTSLTDTKEREDFLYFSDTYITIPAVIVVRKDLDDGDTLTLRDLSGKKVAIGNQYAVEEFVRINNPRIVVESVVDDESGLQQVVLGEVDAAIMDITSLSYYLSKQVLNSVKVVGNTGFEYKLAFAVPKDKEILQSIIDKGLQQISSRDRQIIVDKWVTLPNEKNKKSPLAAGLFDNTNSIVIYVILFFVILISIFFRRKNRYFTFRYHRKKEAIQELQEEIEELEDTSKGLVEELNNVKALEQDIKQKIKNIEN